MPIRLLLIAVLLFVLGCGDRGASTPADAQEGDNRQSAPHDAAGSPVTLSVKSLEETEALIASQAGKVVVADLWALW